MGGWRPNLSLNWIFSIKAWSLVLKWEKILENLTSLTQLLWENARVQQQQKNSTIPFRSEALVPGQWGEPVTFWFLFPLLMQRFATAPLLGIGNFKGRLFSTQVSKQSLNHSMRPPSTFVFYFTDKTCNLFLARDCQTHEQKNNSFFISLLFHIYPLFLWWIRFNEASRQTLNKQQLSYDSNLLFSSHI